MTTKKQGFTLIELLIVVGIITILASAAIVAINPGKHFKQTRNATRWSHMNSVANGVYSYVVELKGTYPPCLYDVDGVPIVYDDDPDVAPWGLIDIDDCTELTPTYISDFPADPQGESYVIGFHTALENRIIIKATAAEAIADDVFILQ